MLILIRPEKILPQRRKGAKKPFGERSSRVAPLREKFLLIMRRRTFIKAGAALSIATALPLAKAQEVPTHNWDNYDFGAGPQVTDRLNQGPFGIEQDAGWYTVS